MTRKKKQCLHLESGKKKDFFPFALKKEPSFYFTNQKGVSDGYPAFLWGGDRLEDT